MLNMWLLLPAILPLIFFALGTRYMWHRYVSIRELEDYSNQEKVALTRQMMALLVLLPYALVIVLLFSFAFAIREFSILDIVIRSTYFKVFNFLIGYIILGYMAISSIRKKVSILNRRLQPHRGKNAILNGILTIVFMSIIGVLYFTSINLV